MKRIARFTWIIGALLLTGVVLPDPANAQVSAGLQALRGPTAPPAMNSLGREWAAVPATRLDRLRGGFVLPSGLLMSFGIERAVYVNGALVATSRVNVPDVARITLEQANALAGLQETLVVQVGEGNTFVPSSMGGVVIQNTLNNQDIRALTTLNIGASTLGMFQDLNTGAALQNALNTAPGRP